MEGSVNARKSGRQRKVDMGGNPVFGRKVLPDVIVSSKCSVTLEKKETYSEGRRGGRLQIRAKEEKIKKWTQRGRGERVKRRRGRSACLF